jgi:hypothetical protein
VWKKMAPGGRLKGVCHIKCRRRGVNTDIDVVWLASGGASVAHASGDATESQRRAAQQEARRRGQPLTNIASIIGSYYAGPRLT